MSNQWLVCGQSAGTRMGFDTLRTRIVYTVQYIESMNVLVVVVVQSECVYRIENKQWWNGITLLVAVQLLSTHFSRWVNFYCYRFVTMLRCRLRIAATFCNNIIRLGFDVLFVVIVSFPPLIRFNFYIKCWLAQPHRNRGWLVQFHSVGSHLAARIFKWIVCHLMFIIRVCELINQSDTRSRTPKHPCRIGTSFIRI